MPGTKTENQEATLGEFDTEANLFETINDTIEDEDDEENEFMEKTFESFGEDDDDEDLDEDDDRVDFEDEDDSDDDDEDDDEDDDDEDDDDELTEKQLESFNRKLGTDFKSVEELKKSFKADDDQSASDKEAVEYSSLSNKIVLFDKYIGMDNETLVKNQLISQASSSKKDINDPDVLEEIEEKIEGLKDLDQLDSFAETLRSNLQTQKDKTQVSIDKIEAKQAETENAISQKNTDDLQNALSDIFVQKEFMGVTVSKKDIQDVYKDITNNKFFEGVNGNQEMIAKFAMFVKYEKEISKIANKPTHSENTKKAFDYLAGNGKKERRSLAQAQGSASSGSALENLNNWMK